MKTLLLLVATFASMAEAAAPAIVSQRTRCATLEFPGFSGNVTLFTITWDQDIVIGPNKISLSSLTGATATGSGDNINVLPNIVKAEGIAQLYCASINQTYHSTGAFTGNGPPQGLMLVPPTAEPGYSLVSLIAGATFPETYASDQTVFAL